ncbi:MAG: FAD-binding oxidoreductase [Ectothiorhodospiraceae bacterium]|nr:FAD-binding oxidoreductase [Chromatiales bacterium]MCP5156311.1 FAD-binding oxidoreductase [Ectothiorhodospiraceae bacterium]
MADVETEVAVVGGGIIGCATAWHLASRGVPVVLLEKGRIAGEQSGRNWGFVRQQGRDPAEIPLIVESLRQWRGLAAETGEDLGFHPGGTLYLADDDAHLQHLASWLPHAEAHGIDTRLVTREGLPTLLRGSSGRWHGALHTPSDGRAEPTKAAPALARAAERRGAQVLTGCAVRGLDVAAGEVRGVVTEQGRVRARVVVCAAGAWTSLLLGTVGVRLPQLKVRSSVLRTGPAPRITDGAVWSREVAIRRREDGGYTVAHGGRSEHALVPDSFRYFRDFLPLIRASRRGGLGAVRVRPFGRFAEELAHRRWRPGTTPSPFETTRVLEPPPNESTLDAALANLKRLFPALADIRVEQRWAGLIDVTPDAVPVIAPPAALSGLVIATGFSGHGFGIGPGAGRLAAELALGVRTCVDPTPFRLERFEDGSARPVAGI